MASPHTSRDRSIVARLEHAFGRNYSWGEGWEYS